MEKTLGTSEVTRLRAPQSAVLSATPRSFRTERKKLNLLLLQTRGVRIIAAKKTNQGRCVTGDYGHGCHNRATRPGEDTPKGSAHVLALCTTPGELAYFVALALQQHGQQPALCKGRG